MADRDQERTARNKDLLVQMGAPPTKAQVLAEIELEINDATELAAALDFRKVV